MTLTHLLPRDTPNADSGANATATASAVTKDCKPGTTWLKLCPHDLAAVVGIIFFVCYVLWGIPLTIRLFKSCKSSLVCLRTYVRGDASSARSLDPENGSKGDADSEFEYAYMDPYYSPTRQLHEFLRCSTQVVIPAPTASPKDKRSPSLDTDEARHVKTRLSHFRFPPRCTSSAFAFSMYSQTDTVVDARDGHGHKCTLEQLDELVASFESHGSRSPYSCSTPVGKGTRRSSGTGSSSFKMFDLDSYSYKSNDADDSSIVFHSGYGDDTGGVALPASPPPAYLDQHPAFGSPAHFGNIAL